MGILYNKERIVDTIVTEEGRRQIAAGDKFNPSFISFTDRFCQYTGSNGIAHDATEKIYFESFSINADNIVFSADDSGTLIGYRPSEDFVISSDGSTLQRDVITQSGKQVVVFNPLSGSDFTSAALGIATGSLKNLSIQNLIRSVPDQNRSKKYTFDLSQDFINFYITNKKPFGSYPGNHKVNVDSTKPLFFDKRPGHLENFKFLPPDTSTGEPYGKYTDISDSEIKNFQELIEIIGDLPFNDKKNDEYASVTSRTIDPLAEIRNIISHDNTRTTLYERHSIVFENTNFSNNLVSQMFEISEDQKKMTKLDVVDFGEFFVEEDRDRPRKQVYFAGKVFIDSNNIPSFINLFTLVFD